MRATLLMSVLMFVALAAAGESRARSTCDRLGYRVVVATDTVAVLSKSIRSDAAFYRRYYGCLRGRERLTSIGDLDAEASGPDDFEAAGNWIAWRSKTCDRTDGCSVDAAHALHVRTRRLISNRTQGTVSKRLVRSGRLVILDGGPRKFTNIVEPYDVRVLVRGRVRVLDSATDIDPESLAVNEKRIYWRRGGAPQTAVMP